VPSRKGGPSPSISGLVGGEEARYPGSAGTGCMYIHAWPGAGHAEPGKARTSTDFGDDVGHLE
jgi:hypothetical protein